MLKSLNEEQGSDRELEQNHGNKLDLLSLSEEERIRVCKEIRDMLQQKIIERKSQNSSQFKA